MDEIWCVATNDAFVMGALGPHAKGRQHKYACRDGSRFGPRALGLGLGPHGRNMACLEPLSMLVQEAW